jgi:hypothetical protein
MRFLAVQNTPNIYVICATDNNNVAGAVLLIEMNGAAPPTFKMRREQPPGAFKMSLWQKCALLGIS